MLSPATFCCIKFTIYCRLMRSKYVVKLARTTCSGGRCAPSRGAQAPQAQQVRHGHAPLSGHIGTVQVPSSPNLLGPFRTRVTAGLLRRSRLQAMRMPRQRSKTPQMPPRMTPSRKGSLWTCSATLTSRSWRPSTRWRVTLLLPTAQGQHPQLAFGSTQSLQRAYVRRCGSAHSGHLSLRSVCNNDAIACATHVCRSASAHRDGGATPRVGGARREHSLLPGRQGGAAVLTEEELLSQRCRALGQLYRAYKVCRKLSAHGGRLRHLADCTAAAAPQVHLMGLYSG